MSRRSLMTVAVPVCAALAAAGVAAASHRRAQSTQAAAATFTATSVTHARTRTCTGADGTYAETTATYSGTAASSDARLDGPLTIRAHSVVDTASGLGWVDGTFRVGGDGSGRAHGDLHAAIAGGKAVGAVAGRTNGAGGKLVASFASAFTATDGFSSGSLGSGTAQGAGVVFERGTCRKTANARSVVVSRLRFSTREVVPAVSGSGRASGTFTLDVTRDANGAIATAKAVFYVNYRFGGSATITGLALYQGARGAQGSVVLDAGTGTVADADGNGNLTKVVDGMSPSLAQALLASPRDYYVQLTTSSTALRAQLGGFGRR